MEKWTLGRRWSCPTRRRPSRRKHRETAHHRGHMPANRMKADTPALSAAATAVETLATEVSPRVRGLFLKNLGDFQTELARIQAGFVPALASWAARKELP